MELWVCGRIWSGEESVSLLLDDEEGIFPWQLVGIYAHRKRAEKFCTTTDHFLFRMELGQVLKGLIEVDYPARNKAKRRS